MTTTAPGSPKATSSWRDREATNVLYLPPFGGWGEEPLERSTPAPGPTRPGKPATSDLSTAVVIVALLWIVVVVLMYGTGQIATPSVGVALLAGAWNSGPALLAILTAVAMRAWGRRRQAKAYAAALGEYQQYLDQLDAWDRAEHARTSQLGRERSERFDRAVPRELCEQVVHGEPGRGLSTGRFGALAEVGREGERRTVAALAPVLEAFPAARLVNGVRWPGTETADIDHVLIVGMSMAVIDSKLWAAGNYWWDGTDLYRDGAKQDHPPRVGAALSALAGKVRAVRQKAWVVVHSDGPLTIELAKNPDVRVVTADQLVEEVGTFLEGERESYVANRTNLKRLLSMMLPDEGATVTSSG